MIASEQQAVLLLMLKRIARFMDDNGIRFYTLGGTTIGALRHNGFIPWDDDIDLLVDRDNFKKLVRAAEHLPWDDMEFNCFETTDGWRKTFGQFAYLADTAYLKNVIFNRDISLGTKIDVMVLDYVPSERIADYMRDELLYQETNIDIKIYKNEIRRFKDDYLAARNRMDTEGHRAVMEELKANLERYAPEESDRRVVRLWGRRLRDYQADWYEEPVYYDFEDMRLPVPTRPEACLRLQYGYDWYLVPARGRKVHHFFYNRDIPNEHYFADLSQFIDFDEADEHARQRKRIAVSRLDDRITIDCAKAEAQVQRALMKADLESRADELHERFAKGDYSAVLGMVWPLWVKRKHLMFVPPSHVVLPSGVLDEWVTSLIMEGRYYDAPKILFALQRDPAVIEEPGSQWNTAGGHALLETVLGIAEAYQDRDYDLLEERLGGLTGEQRHTVPDAILALVRLRVNGRAIAETPEELLQLCDAYLAWFPRNHDIVKAKGDVLELLGEHDEAMELYRTVHAKTRNGLDVLELEKRYGFESRY